MKISIHIFQTQLKVIKTKQEFHDLKKSYKQVNLASFYKQ